MAKDLIDIILVGVQIATLIALIIYVKKTWDMAVSTEKSVKVSEKTLDEMKETRDQEAAPYVVAYFDFQDHEIDLVVENVGKGLARDIKIEFEPKLQNSDGEEINDLSMIKDGIGSIPPKYKIKTFFDLSFSYFEKELPLKYKVKISYFGGLKDEKRTTEQLLDIGFYKNTIFLSKKGINDLVKEVENINKNNEKINSNLEKMSVRLDNGIWIKNPEFVINNLETTDSWNESIMSVLMSFKIFWSHIYNKNRNYLINPFRTDLQNRIESIASQILLISSKSHHKLPDDLIDDINEISSKLLDLSNHKFYMAGGRSVKSFNDSGNEILVLVEDTIEKLK